MATLTAIALSVIVYTVLAPHFARSSLTAPLLFMLAGALLGADVAGVLELARDDQILLTLGEVTLAIVLFADATRIDLRAAARQHQAAVRLLALGMPLSILLGVALGALLFPSLSGWELVLLATVLAPTDAALAQPVLRHAGVPGLLRQTINVESGLNDGLAVPIVTIAAIGAGSSLSDVDLTGTAALVALQAIGVGLGCGAGAGLVVGQALARIHPDADASSQADEVGALATPLLAFGAAEVAGGSGFIAAFAAGVVMGNTTRHLCGWVFRFAEEEGQILIWVVFLLVGAVLLVPTLEALSWRAALFGLCSVFVLRTVSAALVLWRLDLRWDSVALLSWFGPRGLASVILALLVAERAHLPHAELIFTTAIWTVALSVVVHGLSAFPAAEWLSRRLAATQRAGAPEWESVEELPLRVRRR